MTINVKSFVPSQGRKYFMRVLKQRDSRRKQRMKLIATAMAAWPLAMTMLAPEAAAGTPTSPSVEMVQNADFMRPSARATALATGSVSTNAVSPTTTFTGLGFDACETPPVSTMRAWLSSPYRAVNVYMGGVFRACSDQPNLTPKWVHQVTQMGWAIIPTYVGLQAPCIRNSFEYKALIKPGRAASEGTQSAVDAIAVMSKLGMGAGSPVYFDFEPIENATRSCAHAMTSFISSWTTRLHQSGYVSGVYGEVPVVDGQVSTTSVLISAIGSHGYVTPDDLWFADWSGTSSIFGDRPISDALWPNQERIHQYFGDHNETHGGVTINIDSDAVDGATVGAGSLTNNRAPFVFQAYTNGMQTPAVVYNMPSESSGKVGIIPFGGDVPVVCQIPGKKVRGRTFVWDRIVGGGYVSDDYVTTPGFPGFSRGIPLCSLLPPSN